jgi:hypothetical protein
MEVGQVDTNALIGCNCLVLSAVSEVWDQPEAAAAVANGSLCLPPVGIADVVQTAAAFGGAC